MYKWVKRVIGRVRTSTRSVPPQAETGSEASRTRHGDHPDEPPRGLMQIMKPGEDRTYAAVMEERRRLRSPLRVTDGYGHAPKAEWPVERPQPGIAYGRPANWDEAGKVFMAYLEGDEVAAKIVQGWASRAKDRCAPASGETHDDAQQPHDPYAPGCIYGGVRYYCDPDGGPCPCVQVRPDGPQRGH